MIQGEPVHITRALRTQGTHWVCGEIQLPRASQEELTTTARAIIAEDERPPIPPAPPTISIRECQDAIAMAGGISITLRGKPACQRSFKFPHLRSSKIPPPLVDKAMR